MCGVCSDLCRGGVDEMIPAGVVDRDSGRRLVDTMELD